MTTSPTVPTLVDADVRLRAHRPDDAAGVLEQCRDPLSQQWTTVPLDYTHAQAAAFVTQAMPGGWADNTEWGFAVEAVDETGLARFGGTVSLRNEGEGRAELAYGSHPWVRGRGVMERALRLLLAWGFDDLGLETVVWWANQGNWASRRLAWRLGFSFEGTLRQWLPQRGELIDAWVGTLLAGDPRQPVSPWYDVPLLAGGGVVLRRHRPADIPRIVEACNDPETLSWLGSLPAPYTATDAQLWLDGLEDRHAAGTAVTWAVADPATDLLVGTVNLFDVRPGLDAEVGYWVHPDARGHGVGTSACRLAVRHAFVPADDGGLGLGRVRAVSAEGNGASRRVLEKSGLVYQGRERRVVRVGAGGLADGAIYDRLAGA